MSSPYELQKLKAENEALTKRVAELETLNAVYVADMEEMRGSLLALQSQLAWTPVADGLPAESGLYAVLWSSREITGPFTLDEMSRVPAGVRELWTHFRRVTLPEAT